MTRRWSGDSKIFLVVRGGHGTAEALHGVTAEASQGIAAGRGYSMGIKPSNTLLLSQARAVHKRVQPRALHCGVPQIKLYNALPLRFACVENS